MKEFQFNPFIHRIIEVLITINAENKMISLINFLQVMNVFRYDAPVSLKKEFMFKIYDKQNKGFVSIVQLRNILTNELFVRSHYSEVDNARGDE